MLFGNKSAAVDWLVAGLGNPGQKYANTRHNMGFLTVDLLAEEAGVKLNKVKFKSAYNVFSFGGAKCLVMKPQTYMNLSGEAVGEAARFYKIPAERVLVIYYSPSGHPGLPPDQNRHRRSDRRRGGDDQLGDRRALPKGPGDPPGELPPGHPGGGVRDCPRVPEGDERL